MLWISISGAKEEVESFRQDVSTAPAGCLEQNGSVCGLFGRTGSSPEGFYYLMG
jgi:hypothetical protein